MQPSPARHCASSHWRTDGKKALWDQLPPLPTLPPLPPTPPVRPRDSTKVFFKWSPRAQFPKPQTVKNLFHDRKTDTQNSVTLKMSVFYPTRNVANFGPTPSETLSGPKGRGGEEGQNLKISPHPKCWPMLGRPLNPDEFWPFLQPLT